MPPLHRHSRKNGPPPIMWVDVDDTILDLTGILPAGFRGVERWAGRHMDAARARRFAAAFERGNRVSLERWHGVRNPASDAYRARLQQRLTRVRGEGPKPLLWPREAWLELAAEEAGAALSKEQLAECAHEYWRELAEASTLYPGVPETLAELKLRGYRVYLLSSSDCRLLPDGDGWRYEPEPAMEWKRERLQRVLAPLAGSISGLLLGDPYEKSGPEFFRHALEMSGLEAGGLVISVGDSLDSDLRLAREADPAVRFTVLCDPHGRYKAAERDGADAYIPYPHGLLEHFF